MRIFPLLLLALLFLPAVAIAAWSDNYQISQARYRLLADSAEANASGIETKVEITVPPTGAAESEGATPVRRTLTVRIPAGAYATAIGQGCRVDVASWPPGITLPSWFPSEDC